MKKDVPHRSSSATASRHHSEQEAVRFSRSLHNPFLEDDCDWSDSVKRKQGKDRAVES